MIVACPQCGEEDDLRGSRDGEQILVVCERCGTTWERDVRPRCDRCNGDDMVPAVKAVVEKGRGTQLSVVGTRVIHLCAACDAATLRRYFDNRPNPLMPDQLPNVGPEHT